MGDDKSDAHSYYDMPCKTLFEGMELDYAPVDGEFKNQRGDVVVKNINYRNLIIKKSEILSYLEKNNLDIIWTLTGEKLSFSHNDRENNFRKKLSGIFYLDKNEITGKINSYNGD